MNKGQITITITIGLMCALLMFVMFMQFKTVDKTDIASIKNMRETELRAEIASLKSKYNEAEEKLLETKAKNEEYKEKVENNQEASQLLDKELQQSELMVGKTDVYGPGIIVTLNDGLYETEKIMAYDLLMLVNELNLAGAEAISINDERIISMTDIVDVSSHIRVNKQRLTSPFIVKAIGNQTYLESGITAKGMYVDIRINEGKSVKVEKEKTIEIFKYNEDMKLTSINM